MFVRVHTPMLAANLWRRLRDRRWSGFLHVRPIAGGNDLPEAPSPDQSNLLNIKSVCMDRDPKNLAELIIGRCWGIQNKRDVKAGITSCRLLVSAKPFCHWPCNVIDKCTFQQMIRLKSWVRSQKLV